MASEITKKYEKLISLFSKDEFDGFVKCFIRNYWLIPDVVVVDGTNDGGTDVKVFVDKNDFKVPIQLTIQKLNVSKKLEEDFDKVRDLVRNHGYKSHLIFFYSQTMSEETQRALVKKAREEYSLTLEILDAKSLAGLAESYPELRSYIHDKSNLSLEQGELVFDRETKMLYDLISYGNETSEIKTRILECFILHSLYEKEPLEIQKLSKDVYENFGANSDTKLCWRTISKLSSDKRVLVTGGENGSVILSQSERERINKIKENFKFEEEYFNYSLNIILEEFSLSGKFQEVRNALIKFFRENYELDLYEITSGKSNLKTTKDAYDTLRVTLADFVQQELLEELIKKLIIFSNENDILQRICAGEAFTKLTNPENLQHYINNIEHQVYLDTSVMLYIICVLYQKAEYDNPKYQAALNFINFIETSNDNINLHVSSYYLEEITSHLKDALDLAPYVENNLIEPLGGSLNVFINFYFHLKNTNQLEDDEYSYEDYLIDFNINPSFEGSTKDTKDFIRESIEHSLVNEGYEIVDIPNYSNFELIKKELENLYSITNKKRPHISAVYDAYMLCHLFDADSHTNEPSFITWDNSFQDFRREYHKKHPKAQFWHLFTPSKFVSHLSLLRFKVNSESLTNEILSLVEDDFEIRNKVKNLLDSIATLINIKSKHGLRIARVIADFRSNSIYQINAPTVDTQAKIESKPIDEILFSINDYYRKKAGKFDIDQLKLALNNEQQTDNIILLLQGELEYLLQNSTVRQEHLLKTLDQIISDSL